MKVTISEAARLAGISRQQLYRGYINNGKISVMKELNKSLIDTSELLRVFPNATIVTDKSDISEQIATDKNDTVTIDNSELITLLKHQLVEAKEREEWLKLQLEKTTHLLEDKTTKRKKFLGIF